MDARILIKIEIALAVIFFGLSLPLGYQAYRRFLRQHYTRSALEQYQGGRASHQTALAHIATGLEGDSDQLPLARLQTLIYLEQMAAQVESDPASLGPLAEKAEAALERVKALERGGRSHALGRCVLNLSRLWVEPQQREKLLSAVRADLADVPGSEGLLVKSAIELIEERPKPAQEALLSFFQDLGPRRAPTREVLGAAYLLRGIALYRLDEYEESVTAFQQCLAVTPGNRWARKHLAQALTVWALHAGGLPQKGPETLQRARSVVELLDTGFDHYGLKSSLPAFHNAVGVSQARLGQWVEAEKTLQKVADGSKDFLEARLNLGTVAWRRQEDPKLTEPERENYRRMAYSSFVEAARRNGLSEVPRYMAAINAGAIALKNDPASVPQYIDIARTRGVDLPYHHYLNGLHQEACGKKAEAAAAYTEALTHLDRLPGTSIPLDAAALQARVAKLKPPEQEPK